MIPIDSHIALDERHLDWSFVRAPGPGGQNVNKVATAVQLRFNLPAATYLPAEVSTRLHDIARKRINKEGYLLIEARRFRTQERNREDAIQRLILLIRQALVERKPRVATKPSLASKRRRLEGKLLTGAKKRLRRTAATDE